MSESTKLERVGTFMDRYSLAVTIVAYAYMLALLYMDKLNNIGIILLFICIVLDQIRILSMIKTSKQNKYNQEVTNNKNKRIHTYE